MSPTKKTLAILPSFVLPVVFAVALSDTDLRTATISAYGVWAWYWGLVLVWPVYRKLSKHDAHASIFWFIPYWCGSLGIGFLGGGIFQFIKFVCSPSQDRSNKNLEQSVQRTK